MTFGEGLGVMRDDINRLRASVASYLEREALDDALDDLQVLRRLHEGHRALMDHQ